jgi:hypothetical protein
MYASPPGNAETDAATVEEAIIVSLVIIVFLFHFRSAFIPILTLPIAVVGPFLPMSLQNLLQTDFRKAREIVAAIRIFRWPMNIGGSATGQQRLKLEEACGCGMI